MEEKKNKSRLMSLELGRGIAALLVCLYHYIGYNEKYFNEVGHTLIFSGGNVGVDYFFVLSGFIIYWVHRNDIGVPGRINVFLKKRFFRIFPIFWVIVAPVGLMMLLVPSLGAEKNLTLGRYLLDLMLIPREGDLTLPPAWTLHRELFFYILFSVYVVRPKAGFFLLLTWQLLCLVNTALPFTTDNYRDLINIPLGPRNLGFGFGLLSGYLLNKYTLSKVNSWLLIVLGLSGFSALIISEGYYMLAYGVKTSHLANAYIWNQGYMVSAFFSILGLVSYELRKPLIVPKPLAALGSASYVLYIVHLPAGSVIYKILSTEYLSKILNPELAFWIAILFTVVVAIGIHFTIEKPILKFTREKFF